MSSIKLTQSEAEELISTLKNTLVEEINFPTRGGKETFQVEGNSKKENFTIQIYRGQINRNKYSISARISVNGIILLQLDINATNKHINPDGSTVVGSHWHIYTEKYGRKYAFKADDLTDDAFVDNTIAFLNKFNVIVKPDIHFQMEIV